MILFTKDEFTFSIYYISKDDDEDWIKILNHDVYEWVRIRGWVKCGRAENEEQLDIILKDICRRRGWFILSEREMNFL